LRKTPTRVFYCGICRRNRRFVRTKPETWICPCGRGQWPAPAKEKFHRVTIDAGDIEKGVRGSPRRCAMARAIRRAGCRDVAVTGETIILAGGRIHLAMTPEMQAWTSDWDARRTVQPFRFRIELGDYRGIVVEGALAKGKAT